MGFFAPTATCGHDRILAFSCKVRGFCRACLGRRMVDTAAHLFDRVLPEVLGSHRFAW
jgi:hypothetical protein